MNSSEFEPEESRLRDLLSYSIPPTPDLALRLRRRLRHRRTIRLVLAAAAVLLLALWQLPWNPPEPSWTPERPISGSTARLLWEPPVERLEVLDRQQDALLAVLEQLGQE